MPDTADSPYMPAITPVAVSALRRRRLFCLILLLSFLLSACRLQPVERDLPNEIPLQNQPGQFGQLPPMDADMAVNPPDHWWEIFDRPDLNRIIMSALSDNPGMAKTRARVRRAEALSRAAAARRGPELTASGNLSTTESHDPDRGWSSGQSYGTGLSLSYTLDVWGQLAAEDAAALAERDAVRFDREAAALDLAASISLQWIGLLTETARKQLLLEQRDTNATTLDLMEFRFRNALASALDVLEQRQVVAAIESELPLSNAKLVSTRHILAVLAGKTPDQDAGVTDLNLPDPPPAPPAVLPARLLTRRPDIRAAAVRLLAADWDTVSARADLLPSIRLSADISLSASSPSDLLQSWLTGLAAGITGPVWDQGRRQAAVDAAQASADEQLAAYRDTVLTALREAADALAREQAQNDYLKRLEQELELAEAALAEARERYLAGITDYLSVLTQTKTLLALEQEHIAARGDLLEYRINLYTALGGGWRPEDLSQKDSSQKESL